MTCETLRAGSTEPKDVEKHHSDDTAPGDSRQEQHDGQKVCLWYKDSPPSPQYLFITDCSKEAMFHC